MSRTQSLTVLAVTTLLMIPAATATWYSYGTYEPDTTLDDDTLGWHEVPGAIKNRVYFNAYYSSGPGLAGANGELMNNPNVGVLHTNLDPQNSAYFEAVLGVWTDCNQDGYIGMVETAVREYDARLLLDDDLCPLVTGPKTAWTAGANNYNGWVTELIPIGNSKTTIPDDSRIYVDNGALVWAEPGKPTDGVGEPGIVCYGRDRGDSQTTGGIIWQLDCQGNGMGVGAGVGAIGFNTGTRVKIVETFNSADATLGTGLGFGNDPANSGSPLNQPTFGSEDSSNSAVYVQDCDAEPMLNTGDVPVGDDADDVTLFRGVPANPVNGDVNSWTVPGTLNYTAEAVWTPHATFGPDNPNDPNDANTANCDFDDDAGQDFYNFLETNIDIPPYNGKDAAWSNFRFQTGSRGTLPATAYPAGSGVGASNGGGRAGVATDLGIEALGAMCTASSCVQSGWKGAFIGYNSQVIVTRYTIDDEHPEQSTASADLPAAPWFSFFAFVSGETTGKGFAIPGGSGVYGAAQCGGNDSGQHNGWNCDPAAWYRLSDGSYPPTPGGVGVRAVVGQQYNLLDVDCFDGSLGEYDVGTTTSYYGESPCTRPNPK